jgi:hypothetical protein
MNTIYTDNTLDLENLARTPEVQADYESYLKVIKNAGSTPQEVILNKLEGKKLAKVLNEFPYDLGEGLEHWLVWNNTGEELAFKINQNIVVIGFQRDKIFVAMFVIAKKEVVALFENTPSKKSVDLKHYHLILKK